MESEVAKVNIANLSDEIEIVKLLTGKNFSVYYNKT